MRLKWIAKCEGRKKEGGGDKGEDERCKIWLLTELYVAINVVEIAKDRAG